MTIGRALLAVVLCFCAAPGLAQDPAELFEKAPPDIDEALRARIRQFYQYHVEGKFRAADALVAEDSKDAFFNADKPRCSAFDITRINYADNFTRAQALVVCDTEVFMMMVGKMPVKMPLMSLWKRIGGEWFWYVESRVGEDIDSPFGVHKAGAGADAPSSGARVPAQMVSIEQIHSMVKADRQEVRFDAASAGEEQVKVSNAMPGGVTLSVEASTAPGMSLEFDRTNLGMNESAVLTIRYQPTGERTPDVINANIVVMPTNQVIPLAIRFTQPPPKPRPN